MEAETALLSAWPFWVREADSPIAKNTITVAMNYLNIAETFALGFVSSPHQGDWPLPAATKRAKELLALISSRQPPDPHWYTHAKLLGQYAYVFVAPTPPIPVWKARMPRMAIWPSLEEFRRCLHDVLVSFRELEVEFFPVKGSLIGFLRYGATIGALPDGKWDLVDNDLDFWVRIGYEEWTEFCENFTTLLLRRGWSLCNLGMPRDGPSHVRMPRALNCQLSVPFLFRIEVTPFDRLGNHLVDTKVCSDQEQLIPVSWSSAPHQQTLCRYPADGLWVDASLVYPLTRCKAFNLSIPCPGRPGDFLRSMGSGSCLSLPVILPTRDCGHPWNQRLWAEWSSADVGHLVQVGQKLASEGYASFANESSEHCSNHSIVETGWWWRCLRALAC